MFLSWNLFVLDNKEINFVRKKAALFHVRCAKVGPSPSCQTWKKPFDLIWRHLWSIRNEAIPLVTARWQRIVIGLGKSRHCQTWLECRFSWNENLQRRKNWISKSTSLQRKCWKSRVRFLSSDQPSEPKSLDVALNIARVEKYARKTCDCGQPGGHSIRSSFEPLCPLWSVNLKSVSNSVRNTF